MTDPQNSTQAAADLTEQEQELTDIKKELLESADYTKQIIKKISEKAFAIDLMKDPEEAILSRSIRSTRTGENMTDKVWQKWHSDYMNRIFSRVAERTGADPEQIQNPENRTPEIQHEILLAAAEEQEVHRTVFFRSRYYQACQILNKLRSDTESQSEGDPVPMDDESPIPIKGQAILYFFAVNNLNPADIKPLEEKQIQELKSLFYRLDKFYKDNPISKDAPEIESVRLFNKFIELGNPNPQEIISTTKIITQKIQEIAYPVDKVNSNLWGLTIGEKAELKAESDSDSSKGKQASIYVVVDFEEMENTGITISRPLTSYDKRIFIAAANLKDQGHDTVTTAQIYEAMGNRGKPNARQREKILKSLEIMSLCRVTLDNTEEAKLYTKYDKVNRTFYLLPTTIDKGFVNGLIVDDAITIMELPKLYAFAKDRGQFAATPVKLLETPLSQTEANLLLEDYLFTRIVRMKNAIEQHRKNVITTILLDTVYKNCDINDKHKRSRAKPKIEDLLNYYKKQGFIKGFTLTSKNIEIDL